MPIVSARRFRQFHAERSSAMKNAETVRKIYEAFGRGDVPGILEHVSEDIDWEYAYENTGVPWLVRGKGRAHVAKFFETAMTALECKSFEPKHIFEADNLVVALCDSEWIVRATGKRIVEKHEPHVWHFDDKGRLVRFRHAADTKQQFDAVHA